MKRIKRVVVEYEDGSEDQYDGTGREPMVSTSVEEQQENRDPEHPHKVTTYHTTVMTLSLLLDRVKVR